VRFTLQWPQEHCRADLTALLTCSRLHMSAGELRLGLCWTTSCRICGIICMPYKMCATTHRQASA
jgi:hypothetical protein